MKALRENSYLRGYMHAFSIFPTGKNDDPWENIRVAYDEVGAALWHVLLDWTPVLEEKTRGTKNEQKARELGRKTQESYEQLAI